jgi:hypothetical protein
VFYVLAIHQANQSRFLCCGLSRRHGTCLSERDHRFVTIIDRRVFRVGDGSDDFGLNVVGETNVRVLLYSFGRDRSIWDRNIWIVKLFSELRLSSID